MRADVVEPFALLGGIEEPRRPDVRRARDHLHQVMDAFHVHARIGFSAFHDLAERRRIVDQRALQHRRDLEALGHDVVGDRAFLIGFGEHRFQLRQFRRGQNPRLVGEHVQAAVHRPRDAIDFRAVLARQDDGIARPLAQHPVEEVRTDM